MEKTPFCDTGAGRVGLSDHLKWYEVTEINEVLKGSNILQKLQKIKSSVPVTRGIYA